MADPSLYWENLYGEVVWAKVDHFEWWPCYVFDPNRITDKPYYAEKGKSAYRKKYTVMFYNDQTWGWTTPNLIQPFTDANIEKFRKQKIQNGYVTSFRAAIKEAQDDAMRAKKDRLAWYFKLPEIGDPDISAEPQVEGLSSSSTTEPESIEVSKF